MPYTIKEIFYSLQGEGAQSGRAVVFIRFAGCNLDCDFCDTDFVGTDGALGGRYPTASALAQAALSLWQGGQAPNGAGAALPETSAAEIPQRWAVLTGGEPLLQADEALVAALHSQDFAVALESNGTRPALPGLDWVCISPKAGAPLVQLTGDELKLVYPQAGAEPELYRHLAFRHFFLQPRHDAHLAENTRLAVQYCLAHPQWRLSLQAHKYIGIP